MSAVDRSLPGFPESRTAAQKILEGHTNTWGRIPHANYLEDAITANFDKLRNMPAVNRDHLFDEVVKAAQVFVDLYRPITDQRLQNLADQEPLTEGRECAVTLDQFTSFVHIAKSILAFRAALDALSKAGGTK